MDFKTATDLLALPLEEVAEKLGKKYSTIMAYRNGTRRVPPEVWEELAAHMREHGGRLADAADELTREGK